LGQIGVDFDISQSNLVGLQVDFGNQKSNRYAMGNRRILRICEPIYGSQNAKLSDAPEPRAKQAPECGPVIEIAEVGGLHHRYERRAA